MARRSLIRKVYVGSCSGVRSDRQLCEEVQLNPADARELLHHCRRNSQTNRHRAARILHEAARRDFHTSGTTTSGTAKAAIMPHSDQPSGTVCNMSCKGGQ